MANAQNQIVPADQKLAHRRDLITRLKPQLATALPKHMNVDRLIRMIFTALNQVPGLIDCSERSLLHAAMECAQAGLEPGGALGQAYILPFKSKHSDQKIATFIPGYKGLISLGRRSGEVQDVYAEVVYENDRFEVHRGTEPRLVHEPNYEAHGWANLQEEIKSIKGFYAVGFLKDTPVPHFEYMTKRQVDAVMRRSPGHGESGPWVTDYPEMGKKTAIKRLMKFMPMSSEDQRLQLALARDEMRDAGLDVTDPQIIDTIATVVPDDKTLPAGGPAPSKLDQMADKVEKERTNNGRGAVTEIPEVGPEDIDLGAPAGDGSTRTSKPLPLFNADQRAVYDRLMQIAGGDEEKALSALRIASVIKPGGQETNLNTWEELQAKGSATWLKATLKGIEHLPS